jgi:glutamate dehydrogenase (NAD(P)+)
VQIQKLASTDAFIVFDLDDAPSAGITRSAPKILVDGATALARTLTYRFATFERQVGGASAGVNAAPVARPEALAAFVSEVEPLVRDGRLLTDPGRGVPADAFGGLREVDPRPSDYWGSGEKLTAIGVAAAADAATGGLAGRRVAVEGFDQVGVEVAAQLAARGAKVVAVATADGTAVAEAGLEPGALAAAWAEHGAAMVGTLAGEASAPAAVFGVAADVLVTGSKTGVVDHDVAAGVEARVVVPSGPIPVTAKALAALRRRGVVVLPDFVSTAGPMFAGWPDDAGRDAEVEAAVAIERSLLEVLSHADGPLLGACYRAEAFLSTWRSELPFGRPLA